MLYRVRGPLHPDTTFIATELRGLIAHTGPIRLGYLHMHGVAAQTIQVRDDAAAFFEETLLPKIGAAGSFIEQRFALRRPRQLTLVAALVPTTATALPDLRTWAGVWSEVVYGPRRATVRLRCLPDDAARLRALEGAGWRVLRGSAALGSWLGKAASFAPQFWPVDRAAAPTAAATAPSSPASPVSAPAPPAGPALSTADVLAATGAPNLLLGVTPDGEGVRLAWRSMIVSVQDGGGRQEAVVSALLGRALAQGMGALVIAERANVTPRRLSPLAERLRIIDMADPWESARIPWRTLPPDALALLLGGALPSPPPATLADALRAVGRRGAATPVFEALTREPAYDLAGTLEAGGGVVLLLEPGASASLLASLLILGLSLAPLTRPLLICRPAALPVPPHLADRAVQVVFGDAPTAALRLRATAGGWTALVPDGTQIALQESLAASAVEQAGIDHAALVGGLQGLGWASDRLPPAGATESAVADLNWTDGSEPAADAGGAHQEAADAPGGAAVVSIGWPDDPEPADDTGLTLSEASDSPEDVAPDDAPFAGLGWTDGSEPAGDTGLPLQEATDATDPPNECVAAPSWLVTLQEAPAPPDDAPFAGLGWTDGIDAADDTGLPLQDASDLPDAPFAGLDWPDDLDAADDTGLPLQDASDLPDAPFADLGWPDGSDAAADAGLSLSEASAAPEEMNDAALFDEWPARIGDDTLPRDDGVDHTLHAPRPKPKPHRRNRLILRASHASRRNAADDAGLPLQDASDLPDAPFADLGWPDGSDAAADAGLSLSEASAAPEDATLTGLGWLGGRDPAAADAGLSLQDTLDPPADDITDLVAAWHDGVPLADLARELRRRRPDCSLLDAMHRLKAAIAAPPPLPPTEPATHDDVEAVLRDLAAAPPTLPAARDALHLWQDGQQRREVVRAVAAAYAMREAEVRMIYDQVVLPRVISAMNGSAAEVIRLLREPREGDLTPIPPPVMDCIARLLGTPRTNAGIVRSLLPVLRETLATLDSTGRP